MAVDLTGKAVKRLRLPTVNYDLAPVPIVSAQVGDASSRVLLLSLYDDAGDIDLSTYNTTTLRAVLPSGDTRLLADTEPLKPKSTQIVVKIPSGILLEEGRVSCNVILYGSENKVLTSQPFYIMVSETNGSEDGEEATEDITNALNAVMAAASAAQEAASAAQEAAKAAEDKVSIAQEAASSAQTSAEQAAEDASSAANSAKSAAGDATAALKSAEEAERSAGESAKSAQAAQASATAAAKDAKEATDIAAEAKQIAENNVPIIGDDGNWHVNGVDTEKPYVLDVDAEVQTGDVGSEIAVTKTLNADGRGVTFNFTIPKGKELVSVVKEKTEGLVDTYKISYNDGTNTTFEVVNGRSGVTGVESGESTSTETITETPITFDFEEGNSQTVIVKAKNGDSPTIGEDGNWYVGDVDTGKPYVINVNAEIIEGAVGSDPAVERVMSEDGRSATFKFTLPKAADGVSVESITLKSTAGLVDTYEVKYSNETTSTFTVKNGEAATIEVGRVVDGDYGSGAKVWNTGDEHNAVFNFSIPKGSSGAIRVESGDPQPSGDGYTITPLRFDLKEGGYNIVDVYSKNGELVEEKNKGRVLEFWLGTQDELETNPNDYDPTLYFVEGVDVTGGESVADQMGLTDVQLAQLSELAKLVYVDKSTNPPTLYIEGTWQSVDSIDDKLTEALFNVSLQSDDTYKISSMTDYGKGFENIVVPENYKGKAITVIADQAFQENDKLKSISLPNTITEIGSYAFEECTNLEELTIPDGVTSLSSNMATACSNLTTVKIGKGVTSITLDSGHQPFSSCPRVSFEVSPENTTYKAVNGNLIEIATKTLVCGSRYCVIPDETEVTKIGVGAFNGIWDKEVLEIPSYITQIGALAFSQYGEIKEAILPFTGKSYGASDGNNDIGYIFGSGRTPHKITIYNSPRLARGTLTNIDDLTITPTTTKIATGVFWRTGGTQSKLTIPFIGTNKNSSTDASLGDMYGWGDDTDYPGAETIVVNPRPFTTGTVAEITNIYTGALKNATAIRDVYLMGDGLIVKGALFYQSKYYSPDVVFYCEKTEEEADSSRWASGWNANPQGGYYPVVWDCLNNHVANDGNIYYRSEGGSRYILKDGEATLTYCSESDLTIPEKIVYDSAEYTVTTIGAKAFRKGNIMNLVIPETVTTIASDAFAGCLVERTISVSPENPIYESVDSCLVNKTTNTLIAATRNATIPTSVVIEVIGDYAFNNNATLQELEFPSTIKKIGNYAFSGCTDITLSELPSTIEKIGKYAFYNCTSIALTALPSTATQLGQYAFAGCTNLAVSTLPAGITSIPDGLFKNCALAETFTVPASVTTIGSYVFDRNSSLKHLTMGDEVVEMGGSNFNGCANLIDVRLSNNIKSLGYYSFYDCPLLESVNIPNNISSAFDKYSTFVNVPKLEKHIEDGITYLASEASNYCALLSADTSIATVTINPATRIIVANAFDNCDLITDVTIPETVLDVGDDAFSGCDALETVSISSKWKFRLIFGTSPVKYITITGDNDIIAESFQNKTTIQSVTFTGSPKVVGQYAFQGCTGLTTMTLPEGLETIERYAFQGCTGLTSISIPDSLNSIGQGAFDGCTSLEYNTYEGASYLGNATNPYLVLVQGDSSAVEVDINSQTKTILSGAFSNSTSLETIKFHDTITSINGGIFNGSHYPKNVYVDSIEWLVGLEYDSGNSFLYRVENVYINNVLTKTLTIPASVTEIKSNVFKNVSAFTEVKFADGCTITSCPEDTFQGFKGLLVKIPFGDGITSISIGGTPNILSLVVPSTATQVNFINCDKLLEVYNLSDIDIRNATSAPNIIVIHDSLDEPSILEESEDGAIYASINGTYHMVAYRSNGSTEIVLPDTYKSEDYLLFYGVLRGTGALTSITVPYLGASAWYSDSDIGYLFGDYNNGYRNSPKDTLEEITITKAKFLSWNNYDIRQFSKLTKINIPDTIISCDIGTENLQVSEYENGYYIGNETNPYAVFLNIIDTTATSLVLHENTRCINYSSNLFSTDTLTSITFPDGFVGGFATSGLMAGYNANLQMTEYGNGKYLGSATNPYLIFAKVKDFDITSLEIHPNTKIIGVAAFCDMQTMQSCTNLTQLEIPSNVKTIDQYGLVLLNVQSITIPNNVENMLPAQLVQCVNLMSTTLPSTLKEMPNTFMLGCPIESITIPEGVIVTNYQFVTQCESLKTINLPSTISKLGRNTINECPALETINFNGTKKQWNSVVKDEYWLMNSGSPTIHCTDGNI